MELHSRWANPVTCVCQPTEMVTMMLCKTGRAVLTVSVVFALALSLVGLYLGPAAGKDVAPHKLTILFTASDYGNVKPCG